MKKIFLLLAIIFSVAIIKSNAQDMAKMQMQWRSYLKDSVKLSDVMTDSVMNVRMQYQPQMHQLFMDQSTSMQEKQTKMQQMRTDMDSRYKIIGLTGDQIQMIHQREDAMRAEMMKHMESNGGQ